MGKRSSETHQDALAHGIHAPDAHDAQHAADVDQLVGHVVAVLRLAIALLGLLVGGLDVAVGLGHADDLHDLVVRTHNLAVHHLCFHVDGPAAVVVLLQRLVGIAVTLAGNDNVVRRAALNESAGSHPAQRERHKPTPAT